MEIKNTPGEQKSPYKQENNNSNDSVDDSDRDLESPSQKCDEQEQKKQQMKRIFKSGFSQRSIYEKSSEKVVTTEKPALQIIKEFNPVSYMKESVSFYCQRKNLNALKIEILSGMTVSIMQIPESVAFSFVAGVDPIVGLYATFFMGTITAAIGGKAGMISGAAGALAVVVKNMMDEEGPLKDYDKDGKFHHLMMTMVLCGAIQILCSLLQIAKLVKLIPYSAMIGFMNGLGIIIFISQLQAFTECGKGKRKFQDCKESEREWIPIDAGRTWIILFLTFLTMFIMVFFPKVPKIGKILPSSLVAIIIGTLIEHLISRPLTGEEARTVGETTSIDGKFPVWLPPQEPADGFKWGIIISYSISLCFIGLFESVMTLQFIEEITKTLPSQFKSNQECFAQGLANLICGLFGAMGGDAMIGQSCINVKNNGAKGRLSGMIAGVAILMIIVIAHKVIELIPIATLTGVLFMVVLNTFNWESLTIIFKRKAPLVDSLVIIIVTVLAVLTNLAVAVVIGVIVISIFHNYTERYPKIKILYTKDVQEKQKFIVEEEQQISQRVKVYKFEEYTSFAGLSNFFSLLDPQNDHNKIVIDFEMFKLSDISSISKINEISDKYNKFGKLVYCDNLNDSILQKLPLLGENSKFIIPVPQENRNNYQDIFCKKIALKPE